MTDTGPHFISQEFSEFSRKYQFTHVISSPYYPTSNGQGERTVQTVKQLLKGSEDPFLALLAYRSTPLPWCGRTPAELLMGRNIRCQLPHTPETLLPKWPYLSEFRRKNDLFKTKQKTDYVFDTESGIYLPFQITQTYGFVLVDEPQQVELSLEPTNQDPISCRHQTARSNETKDNLM